MPALCSHAEVAQVIGYNSGCWRCADSLSQQCRQDTPASRS